jgi:hypothetical protein
MQNLSLNTFTTSSDETKHTRLLKQHDDENREKKMKIQKILSQNKSESKIQ